MEGAQWNSPERHKKNKGKRTQTIQKDKTNYFFKSFASGPPRSTADPERHSVPSRHLVPLQCKYKEITQYKKHKTHKHKLIDRKPNETTTKNRYKDKFQKNANLYKRKTDLNTLWTSPQTGNAGRPRHVWKRQRKVDRTKFHQPNYDNIWIRLITILSINISKQL